MNIQWTVPMVSAHSHRSIYMPLTQTFLYLAFRLCLFQSPDQQPAKSLVHISQPQATSLLPLTAIFSELLCGATAIHFQLISIYWVDLAMYQSWAFSSSSIGHKKLFMSLGVKWGRRIAVTVTDYMLVWDTYLCSSPHRHISRPAHIWSQMYHICVIMDHCWGHLNLWFVESISVSNVLDNRLWKVPPWVCSICWVLWCYYFHRGWFQAAKVMSQNMDLGRNVLV